MTTTKPQNFEWINSLRLIALFAVIVLHTTAPLLAQYGKVPMADWFTANVYNSIVRFAVPAFVMITGALLLHREYELGDFLKKRLGRILLPFLFWSLVYVGYSWYNEDITFDGDTWANIKLVLHQLKYGSAYHLWYVYMLIGLYFVIPVIGKFVRNATKAEIRYFLLVWLAVMLLGQPYISRFNPQVDMHYFVGYIGYLVLGHYLTFNVNYSKRLRTNMVILFLVVLGFTITGTYLLYRYTSLITLLYEPLGPAIVLLSTSVFLIARFATVKEPSFITKAKNFACRYNFGIYLGHA